MARGEGELANFVDLLIKHTSIYESPRSFWRWSAYTSIAAVLRDNVWSPDGSSKLYPNIFVLFVAGSGGRKNRPVVLGQKLVEGVNNTKVVAGRASIQGILDELSRGETDAKTGKPTKPGSAIFYAPELAAGIVADEAAIAILTDIYDGKTNFKHILRHSPSFKINQIVFSAFMASSEIMLKGVFDGKAVHGGLLARTSLVFPDEFREGRSLWTSEPEEEKLIIEVQNLQAHLACIAELQGRMGFDVMARNEYDSWYLPFRMKYLREGDSSGIHGRIHTTIKKLAMILCANELELEVKKRHVEEAIKLSMDLLPNYTQFVMSSGKAQIAGSGTTIITAMLARPKYAITVKELTREYWQELGNSEDIAKLLDTLEKGELIEPTTVAGNLGYRLTDHALQKVGKKRE